MARRTRTSEHSRSDVFKGSVRSVLYRCSLRCLLVHALKATWQHLGSRCQRGENFWEYHRKRFRYGRSKRIIFRETGTDVSVGRKTVFLPTGERRTCSDVMTAAESCADLRWPTKFSNSVRRQSRAWESTYPKESCTLWHSPWLAPWHTIIFV